jgi:hypothetical protein
MKDAQKHYLVEFASRYADAHGRFRTLMASAALSRVRSLNSNIASLMDLEKGGELKRFGSGFIPYEVISYFAVGFVTCLEWHARSRFVDIIAFCPSIIEQSDIKTIPVQALSQMVAEGQTIPYLLGAATNVSSIRDYISIFRRVFDGLGIKADPAKELYAIKLDSFIPLDGGVNLYVALDRLFQYRHQLVHEIDFSIIGRYGRWDLGDAQRHGEAIEICITMIESHITNCAPRTFPNRLNAEGYPEDELQILTEEILALEEAITPMITALGNKSRQSPFRWDEALQTSRHSQEVNLQYLDESLSLQPVRHVDYRRDMQIEFLRSRLAFLTILKSTLDRL